MYGLSSPLSVSSLPSLSRTHAVRACDVRVGVTVAEEEADEGTVAAAGGDDERRRAPRVEGRVGIGCVRGGGGGGRGEE